jgi:hypothetical protein
VHSDNFSGPVLAAKVFAGVVGLVICFQVALSLGAPWGELAMGGGFPGVLPPAMRVACIVQALVLVGATLVVLSRSGQTLRGWHRVSRLLIWPIVGLLAVSAMLNFITPSPLERLVWGPVAVALLLTGLRVAVAR